MQQEDHEKIRKREGKLDKYEAAEKRKRWKFIARVIRCNYGKWHVETATSKSDGGVGGSVGGVAKGERGRTTNGSLHFCNALTDTKA